MLKGVTRQIIEINNTASPYFEKAVLYVRPEACGHLPAVLKREAERYLAEFYPEKKFLCARRKSALLCIAAALLLAGVIYLIVKLI